MRHCVVAATHFIDSAPPSLGPFLQTISGDFAKRRGLAPQLHRPASPMAGLAATDAPEQLSFELRCKLSSARSIRLPISSDTEIVRARQQGKELALAMQFSATDSAFIAATVSELARALLWLGLRGEIWLHQLYETRRAGVLIVARDLIARRDASDGRPRDISDLALPEVSRLVDEFHIASDCRRGTTITATKWCRRH